MTELKRTIYNELVDLWQFGERAIEREQLQQRLRAGRVNATDAEVDDVLDQLEQQQLISQRDRIVTWVDTSAM